MKIYTNENAQARFSKSNFGELSWFRSKKKIVSIALQFLSRNRKLNCNLIKADFVAAQIFSRERFSALANTVARVVYSFTTCGRTDLLLRKPYTRYDCPLPFLSVREQCCYTSRRLLQVNPIIQENHSYATIVLSSLASYCTLTISDILVT